MMMKNILFWSLVAASVLFGSCSKDDTTPGGPQPGQKTDRFYLSDETTEAEANPASRASFADGYKIAWEAGDVVAINRGDQYAVQQDAEGRWYIELPVAESYTVYYPASAPKDFIPSGIMGMVLPSKQTYVANSFDPEALYSRAVAQPGEKMVFKYLCSVVKVTLRGTDSEQVSKMAISTDGLGGECIAFLCQLNENGDGTASLGPIPGYESNCTQYVNLAPSNSTNLTLNPGGVDFYFTLFPTTFSKGFTITVTLADGRVMTRTGGVGQTAARGRILAMPALDFKADSSNPSVLYSTDNAVWTPWTDPAVAPSADAGSTLYFKDNASAATPGLTKAHLQALVAAFSAPTEADPRGVTLDFSAATYESDIFPGDVFYTGSAAYGITSMTLPSNIREIEENALRNNKLFSLTLPASLTRIGAQAFGDCRYLSQIKCAATTVPETASDAFSYVGFNLTEPGKVIVPEGTVSNYAAQSGWSAIYGATCPGNRSLPRFFFGPVPYSSTNATSWQLWDLNAGVPAYASGLYFLTSGPEAPLTEAHLTALSDAYVRSQTAMNEANAQPVALFFSSAVYEKEVFPAGIFSNTSAAPGYALTALSLPANITSIADGTDNASAFGYNANLKSVAYSPVLTQIGDYAFAGCGLETVLVPETVTRVGTYAFYEAAATAIRIEGAAGELNVGNFAFSCYDATELRCYRTTPPEGAQQIFSGLGYNERSSSGTTIYIPAASKDAYLTATAWGWLESYTKPSSSEKRFPFVYM